MMPERSIFPNSCPECSQRHGEYITHVTRCTFHKLLHLVALPLPRIYKRTSLVIDIGILLESCNAMVPRERTLSLGAALLLLSLGVLTRVRSKEACVIWMNRTAWECGQGHLLLKCAARKPFFTPPGRLHLQIFLPQQPREYLTFSLAHWDRDLADASVRAPFMRGKTCVSGLWSPAAHLEPPPPSPIGMDHIFTCWSSTARIHSAVRVLPFLNMGWLLRPGRMEALLIYAYGVKVRNPSDHRSQGYSKAGAVRKTTLHILGLWLVPLG